MCQNFKLFIRVCISAFGELLHGDIILRTSNIQHLWLPTASIWNPSSFKILLIGLLLHYNVKCTSQLVKQFAIYHVFSVLKSVQCESPVALSMSPITSLPLYSVL